MRCPGCNKFVSYDEPQCEVQSVEVDGNILRASVTVQLNCQDCGGTLKDAEIEAEAEIEHECAEDAEKNKEWKDGDNEFEVENDGDAEGTNRTETKDRHGKPIKSSRYMKSFYGFALDSGVKCCKCNETVSVHLEGEEQVSSFNECC
jgi:hypothetical protein